MQEKKHILYVTLSSKEDNLFCGGKELDIFG